MSRGQDGLLFLSCTTLPFATLCRFIPAHPARPCPTFGRPVHRRGSPHRLRPGTLLMPFGFHLTMDTLPSGWLVALGPPWLVSSFRFRARVDFSIPSTFSGPRGITPAFGYGAPHSGARGTLTLVSNALLSAPQSIYPTAPSRQLSSHRVGIIDVACPSRAFQSDA